jgi:hypothetical protein
MRALRFSRYLREFGFEPLVVCVDPHPRSPEPRDPSLLEEILPGVVSIASPALSRTTTVTAGTIRWKRSSAISSKPSITFLVPDDRAFWIKAAAKAVCQVAKQHKAKLIWATAQPFSTLLAGLAASKQLNIPLVSDFRDDWTTSSALFRRNEPGRLKRERAQEQAVLAHSSAVITVTPGIVEALQQRTPPPLTAGHVPDLVSPGSKASLRPDRSSSSAAPKPSKVHQILNGFDPAHYPHESSKSEPTKTAFRLTHTGGIYRIVAPTGVSLAKSSGIQGLQQSGLRLLRPRRSDSAQLFLSPERPSCVHNHGFCSHAEIRPALVHSDINLLILERVERVEWLYTGKVFDYFGAKRPS